MRRGRSSVRRVLGSAMLLAVTACGDSGMDPQPEPRVAGTLALTFMTPNADDRAVQIRLRGPGVDRMLPATGLTVYKEPGSSEPLVVVLSRTPIPSGTVLGTLDVSDIATVASFSAQIRAVAADDYGLRQSLVGYSATFSVSQ